MPAEGGSGTQSFLNRIGPIIDFVWRNVPPRHAADGGERLNKGTDKLVGSAVKPADEQAAQAWMDRNVTAACKACVRRKAARSCSSCGSD